MKVDFYVLDAAEGQRALLFACKLIEKAYLQRNKVYVHANSKQEADRLDTMLWTFREDSFIPHDVLNPSETHSTPIQIGYTETLPAAQETLINLCSHVPAFYTSFQNVIEIVFSDPTVQQLARDRFKIYRSNSCDITTHKIKANEI